MQGHYGHQETHDGPTWVLRCARRASVVILVTLHFKNLGTVARFVN
jgi:hypothetical protein